MDKKLHFEQCCFFVLFFILLKCFRHIPFHWYVAMLGEVCLISFRTISKEAQSTLQACLLHPLAYPFMFSEKWCCPWNLLFEELKGWDFSRWCFYCWPRHTPCQTLTMTMTDLCKGMHTYFWQTRKGFPNTLPDFSSNIGQKSHTAACFTKKIYLVKEKPALWNIPG